MALNGSRRDIIEKRRELVGQLRARGMTVREISKALAARRDDPFDVSPATVSLDLKAVKKIWQANAQEAISVHIDRQLAEIQEAKREARQQGNLDTWARLLALEMKLLGTDAPQKFEDWTGQDWREYAKQHGYTEAEVIAEAERIIAASAGGASVDQAAGDRAEITDDQRADPV